VDLAVERFGGIDGLINVARLRLPFGGLAAAEQDFSDWKGMFDINLFGSLTLVRCALPALQAAQGAVVFVSSQTQHHPPYQPSRWPTPRRRRPSPAPCATWPRDRPARRAGDEVARAGCGARPVEAT
jgi:NAD(P)-dependent dehydrogenase (short-subunit alcohol dehydrogenase family)